MITSLNEYQKLMEIFIRLHKDKMLETQHAFIFLCKLIPSILNLKIELDKPNHKIQVENQVTRGLQKLSTDFSNLISELLKLILQTDRSLYSQIYLENFKSLQNLLVIWFHFVNTSAETVFIRHFSDIPFKKNYFVTCNIQIDSFSHVIIAQLYFLELCQNMYNICGNVMAELQTSHYTTLAHYLQIGNAKVKMVCYFIYISFYLLNFCV